MTAPVVMDIDGTSLTSADKALLENPLVGGLILFARNYEDPAQLSALTKAIKQLRSDVIIMVDQEGGRVQRFLEGFTLLPNLRELGEVYEQDPEQGFVLSQAAGYVMASELRALGVDLSLAPVLDLYDAHNPITADRSFSPDPNVVSQMAEHYIQGMYKADMRAVGKHFPGHGAIHVDTHLEKAESDVSYAEIAARDLVPFATLMHKNLLYGVMPGHLYFPEIDQAAVGFSKHWLKDILRTKLGFSGVIFSDDLSMASAAEAGDYPARARLALEAGCDMVLACNQRSGLEAIVKDLANWDGAEKTTAQTKLPLSMIKGLASLQDDVYYNQCVVQIKDLKRG